MCGGSLQIGRWIETLGSGASGRRRGRLEAALPDPAPHRLGELEAVGQQQQPAAAPVRRRARPRSRPPRPREILAAHRQQHAGERGGEALRQPGEHELAREGGCRAGGTAAAAATNAAASDAAAGPGRPVRRLHDRAGHRPFGVPVEVHDAPVAGGAAFEAGLPGLVERLHDEVVEPALPAATKKPRRNARLVHPAGPRAADVDAVGRPADLADDDVLAGIGGLHRV